jgi:putative ABC transport system permease protein
MMKLLRRVLYAFSKERQQRALDEELELHRALAEERLRKTGLTPAEAREASRRALGNVALAREDARHVWLAPWIESVWQDAAYAVRIIRRSPGFALSMIVVMALGIGATSTVFSLVDGLILRSLPVRQPDRLVYLNRPSFSYPVLTELRARGSHVLSDVAAWNLEGENVDWTGALEPGEVLMASGNFYSTLGIEAALGRTFTEADDRIGGGPNGLVAVISYASWQRRFNSDPSAIGRTVRIDRRPFTIIGVAPRGFFGVAPGLAPEVTIPLTALVDERRLRSVTSSWLHILGRMRDGVTVESANAALQSLWPDLLATVIPNDLPPDRRAMYMRLRITFEPAHAGYSRVRNQFRDPLWMLLGLVGLLLTVATASAANLLLARSAARRRELAVRLAIGAGRRRVVRQLLTEAAVWTALGATAGLIVAGWAGGALVAMMSTWEERIALDLGPNVRVLAFTVALAFVTAALAAILPALRATRVGAGSALKEFAQLAGQPGRRWSLGKSLVIAQVALTVLLLFGAALFTHSLRRILAQDAGHNRDGILIVSTDAEAAGYSDARHAAFYVDLLERLKAMPGVQSASLSSYPPISDEDGAWSEPVVVDGAAAGTDQAPEVFFNAVTPGYLGTMGIRLIHGRDFTVTDRPGAAPVVIVSSALAERLFPGENAVGRTVAIRRTQSSQPLEIVGVAGAAKYQRLQEPARYMAFLPAAQRTEELEGENLFAEIKTAGPALPLAESVTRTVRALDGSVPLRIQTVEDRIRESLVTERVLMVLATTLGLSAVALACAALYGLLAYTVSRQTNEIGLRLALGAGPGGMLWMVLRQSLVLGALGIAIGVAAALGLAQYARTLLYQIDATDPAALAAAAAIMLAVALVAGLLPARRAARVDPLVALRSE